MNWKLPNQLTIARVALAGVFFVLLGLYDRGSVHGPALLNWAFAVYIVAGITDVLDGWIARKFHWTSAFGRITDPFVDKVLVVGAFAMLSGRNFALPDAWVTLITCPPPPDWDLPVWMTGWMYSAVQAWMVVVVLSRELIVSAVRGYSESQGIKFPATSAGKIKMFIQSVAICTILFQLANVPAARWAVIVKVSAVWAAVIGTVLSGLGYVKQIRRILLEHTETSS